MSSKRIIVWGIGNYEKRLFDNKTGIDYNNVICFIETVKTADEYRGLPVYDFESLDLDYDYIICAFYDTDSAFSVACEKRIDLQKIVFLEPGLLHRYFNDSSEISEILGSEYGHYARKYRLKHDTTKREQIEWLNYWIECANRSDAKRILIIGDSVMREFRPVLAYNIRDYYIDFLTLSYDVSDDNAFGEIERFLNDIAFQYSYEIVLYNLGFHHNQFYAIEKNSKNREMFLNSQTRIIRLLKNYFPRCICIEGTPERDNSDRVKGIRTLRNEEIIKRNEATKEAASKEEVEFVELYNKIKDKGFKLRDNVHYYQGAYEFIADIIYRAVIGSDNVDKPIYLDTPEDVKNCFNQDIIFDVYGRGKEELEIMIRLLDLLGAKYSRREDLDEVSQQGAIISWMKNGKTIHATLSSYLYKDLNKYFLIKDALSD